MGSLLLAALVLAGWTVLSLPLAVVVGRCLAGDGDLTRAR
jgi:hypothetical protein